MPTFQEATDHFTSAFERLPPRLDNNSPSHREAIQEVRDALVELRVATDDFSVMMARRLDLLEAEAAYAAAGEAADKHDAEVRKGIFKACVSYFSEWNSVLPPSLS